MINWYVDYNGILQVYYNNMILFEISECQNMKEKEIKLLIEEQLKESE